MYEYFSGGVKQFLSRYIINFKKFGDLERLVHNAGDAVWFNVHILVPWDGFWYYITPTLQQG